MKPREFKCWMRSAPGADDYSMFVNEQPNGGFKCGWFAALEYERNRKSEKQIKKVGAE